MHTLYRSDDERGWLYREAWHDEAAGEFVIHHGALGTNGRLTAETVGSAEEAETLMRSFLQQCETDGYAQPPAESQHRITVTYPLKASDPSDSEQRNADEVHHAVLTALAWRGLGHTTAVEPADEDGAPALTFSVTTLHRRKAAEAARGAVKRTDVPLSKVRVRS